MQLFSTIGAQFGFGIPWLLALLPLAIGVLVYAYRRRGRGTEMVVASTLLLEALKRRSAAPRKFTPPGRFFFELLVLLLLVLSAAGLYHSGAKRNVALLIDNSLSMTARDAAEQLGKTRLELAKEEATQIIGALSGMSFSEHRVEVFATNPTLKSLTAKLVSASQASLALDTITPASGSDALESAIARLSATDSYDEIVVLSERTPMRAENNDSRVSFPLRTRFEKGLNNVALEQLTLSSALGNSPDNRRSLSVRLGSYSQLPTSLSLTAFAQAKSGEEAELSSKQVELRAGETKQVEISGLVNAHTYRVQITGTKIETNAIAGDDSAQITAQPQVAEVVVVSPYTAQELGLELIHSLKYKHYKPEQFSEQTLAAHPKSLFIFHQTAPRTLPNNSALFVMPPEKSALFASGDRITAPNIVASSWNEAHPISAYATIGTLKFGTLLPVQPLAWMQQIIGSTSGPALLAGEQGGSRYVLSAFELFPFSGKDNTTVSILTLNILKWLNPAALQSGTPFDVSESDLTHPRPLELPTQVKRSRSAAGELPLRRWLVPLAIALLFLDLLLFRNVRNALRAMVVIALLAATFGPAWSERRSGSSALVLLDISDSINEESAEKLLAQANAASSSLEQLHILPFAGRSAAYRLERNDGTDFRRLRAAWSSLDIGQSNLEMGLAQAAAYEPANVLLVSDGFETAGDARRSLAQLNASGSALFAFVPPGSSALAEGFRIEKLNAPLIAAAEKSVDIRVTVSNKTNQPQRGRLEVKHEQRSVLSQEVELPANSEQVFVAQSDPSKEGIKQVTATLTPIDPQLPPSSEIAFISGQAREKVLLLSGSADDAKLIEETLTAQAYQLTSLVDPNRSGAQAIELDSYSAVVLNNIALNQLPSGFAERLEPAVKGGLGLAMLGGNRGFGLGGYSKSVVEKMLPLECVPPQTEKKRLNVAVTLLLDKSRSMSEEDKISYAQEAARAVIENLKDDDFIEVIGFDSAPFVVVKMAQLREARRSAADRVSRLIPAGRTNPLPAMDEARRSMSKTDAGRKHVILLTDGKIPEAGDFYNQLVGKMRSEGVTFSTVLLGNETDTRQLKEIANAGGGSFYQTADARSLPKIFLKDVKVASGERTLKENTEYQVREGPGRLTTTTVRAFPPLRGYVQTRQKEGANLELITYADERAEPLLASWRYGQGQVKAFTSDANGRWSSYWSGWSRFQTFWSEFIDGLRAPERERSDGGRFDLRYYAERGSLILDVSVFSEQDAGALTAELLAPDKSTTPLSFTQVVRGRYNATLPKPLAGKYELRLRTPARKLTPVAFNLSGELFGERRGRGFNLAVLSELTALGGGKLNPSPSDLAQRKSEKILQHDLTPWVLFAAILLLLLEILRREVGRRWRILFPLRDLRVLRG